MFRERQYFPTWTYGVIGVATLAWIAAILFSDPDKMPWPWRLVVIAFGSLFAGWFLTLRLYTEVADRQLRVRLWPFVNRKIPFERIQTAEVRQYRPIREYGGWGVRYSWRHGKAYNARGNRGVQLVLNDGEKVLVGSQMPEELLAALGR